MFFTPICFIKAALVMCSRINARFSANIKASLPLESLKRICLLLRLFLSFNFKAARLSCLLILREASSCFMRGLILVVEMVLVDMVCFDSVE